MRKGSAFPGHDSSNLREAAPRAGGVASNKSKAVTERHSLSARGGGKAATGAPSRQGNKERARRPRSQQSVEGQRKISDYSRDELISALLKGMGKKWWRREDAIRAASHRLGFRRTGRQIRDAFKPAITGAIRRGLLEYDRIYIRR